MKFEDKLRIITKPRTYEGRSISQEDWENMLPRINQLAVNTLRKGEWSYDFQISTKYRRKGGEGWRHVKGGNDEEKYARMVLLLEEMVGYLYYQWGRMEVDSDFMDSIQEFFIACQKHYEEHDWNKMETSYIKSGIANMVRDALKKDNKYGKDMSNNKEYAESVRENHRRLNEAMAMLIKERSEYRNLEEEIAEVKKHSTDEEFKFLMRDATYGRAIPYRKLGMTSEEYRDKKKILARNVRRRIEEERLVKEKDIFYILGKTYPELKEVLKCVDKKKFGKKKREDTKVAVEEAKKERSVANKIMCIADQFASHLEMSFKMNEKASYVIDDLKTSLKWHDLFHDAFVEEMCVRHECDYYYNKDVISFVKS